jgi:hypothetical protein
MSRISDDRVVLGSLRFKSAPNTDFLFKIPFIQSSKILTEYDRSISISLSQVFDDERQKSTFFRPTCKFQILFKNSYVGYSNYEPFKNQLYYTNAIQASQLACLNPQNNLWYGFPQYSEFDFVRSDIFETGYTKNNDTLSPPLIHNKIINKSASTYNWNHFLSYAYENDYNKGLQAIYQVENNPVLTLNWTVSDGIPFIVYNTQMDGLNVVSLVCPIKHNVNVGEYVKLSFSYLGNDTFLVDSLGNGSLNSDEYIVNIINPGFIGFIFNNNQTGTFKRIINLNNLNETTSKYYVRRHKILTNYTDSILTNAGFEENIFGVERKYERPALTPNNYGRISNKNGVKSYTLSFNKDVDILGLIDNQKRPISELFFTTVWVGYFGWTLGEPNNNGGFYRMRQGWEFNLPLHPVTQLPTQWWSYLNSNSDSLINNTYYNVPLPYGSNNGTLYNFVHNVNLKENDIIDGAICEWNDFLQEETVLNELYHKITFNRYNFDIGMTSPLSLNQFGYYYKPFESVQIRAFSDSIEQAPPSNDYIVPDYSQFSVNRNVFVWKDIYTYGFIDTNGIGVDFPFLNNKHHPYKNIIFRIIPEGTNYREFTTIIDPIIDNCE